MSRFKNWRRIAGWALALAILLFLWRTLVDSWSQVAASGFRFQFNLPLLAVSLVMLVVGRGFAVEAWRRILLALGHPITFRFAFYTWFISNLARYIPGNVWQVATMMVLVERQGVTWMNALLSQVVYTAIALSVTALYGLTLLPVARDYAPLAAIFFLALIVLFALPPVFNLLVRLGARVARGLRRGQAVEAPATHVTLGQGLIPPLCSCLMWTINGTAFYLFVRSLADVPLAALPAFIAMNSAAYFVGYASFITPSGMGFREASLAFLLAPYFPTPAVAIAIAFLTRLWSTGGEMLGVGIAVLGAPALTPPPTSSPTQGSGDLRPSQARGLALPAKGEGDAGLSVYPLPQASVDKGERAE